MSHGFCQHSRLATFVRVCLQIEPGLLSVSSRCFEFRTMRTVAVQTRVAAVCGAPACVDFPLEPAEETPVVSQTAAQPKSMFPSWHEVVTRRSGMCNRATHRHRSAQTDRFWRPPPQAGALPCPKRLLGETCAAIGVCRDTAYPSVRRARDVLGLQPLHEVPLPWNVWKLVAAFCQTESLSCHLVISHFAICGVVMCVWRDPGLAVSRVALEHCNVCAYGRCLPGVGPGGQAVSFFPTVIGVLST